MNDVTLFLIRDANEDVSPFTAGASRATGAKKSRRFQFSEVSVSSAASMVVDSASAARLRVDLGRHFGILALDLTPYSR